MGTLRLEAQSSEELVNQGKMLFEQGNIDSSETVLLSALEADNLNPVIPFVLSQVYFKKYDLNNAMMHLQKALELDKSNDDYRSEFEKKNNLSRKMKEARQSIENFNFDKAQTVLNDVLENYQDYQPPALFYLGIIELRIDNYFGAADNFRKALSIDPGYDKALNSLNNLSDKLYNGGNQIFSRGDYEGALEKYQLVLDLNPDYYQSHFQIGVIQKKLGNYDEALYRFTETVRIKPDYEKGWFALGLTNQKNGDYDPALKAYTKAVEANPNYAKAYAQQGTIYLLHEDYPNAEEAYNMAIQSDPMYVKPYTDLGKLYIKQEKYEEALNSLKTATALDERKYQTWSLLAHVYNVLENCDEGKKSAYHALDIKPKYARAFFELGLSEICLGNKSAALQALEKSRKDRTWRKSAEYEIDKINNPHKYE